MSPYRGLGHMSAALCLCCSLVSYITGLSFICLLCSVLITIAAPYINFVQIQWVKHIKSYSLALASGQVLLSIICFQIILFHVLCWYASCRWVSSFWYQSLANFCELLCFIKISSMVFQSSHIWFGNLYFKKSVCSDCVNTLKYMIHVNTTSPLEPTCRNEQEWYI